MLGVDVGTVRVGVALSDPTGTLASPLETLKRAKNHADLDRLAALVVEHEVTEVVVGEPVHLSGASGASAEDAANYAQELADRIPDVPVILIDERLSTVTAASHLREGGIDSRKQRAVIDQAAAVVILQQFLDSRRPPIVTDAGGSRGQHSSRDALPPYGVPTTEIPATGIPGYGVPRYEPGRYDPPSWTTERPLPPVAGPDAVTGGVRRVSGLLDRSYEETGPLVEPEWWAYGSSDDPYYPATARHSGADRPGAPDWDDSYDDGFGDGAAQQHPSAPLPPRPPGVWDRLRPREDAYADDDETVAHPTLGGPPLDRAPLAGPDFPPDGRTPRGRRRAPMRIR